SLLTSNFVLSETYTALLVRVGRDEAIRWGRAFRAGEAVELVRVDEEVEEEAWSILESHADKAWSYVDATSFALMRREKVGEAFTFDRDFLQRGLLPGARSPRAMSGSVRFRRPAQLLRRRARHRRLAISAPPQNTRYWNRTVGEAPLARVVKT